MNLYPQNTFFEVPLYRFFLPSSHISRSIKVYHTKRRESLSKKLHFFLIFLPVPTDFRECGLPEWIVNRSLWTSLDAKWSLKMTPGSSRRFRMLHRTKSRKRGTVSWKTFFKIVHYFLRLKPRLKISTCLKLFLMEERLWIVKNFLPIIVDF